MSQTPSNFVEEILRSGPKDFYEVVAIGQQADAALELLVRQLQAKDRMLNLVFAILRRELGPDWMEEHLGEGEPNE
jgi:acyl CoA:acetate/3-ketoacid CoA transferase alpha subunit